MEGTGRRCQEGAQKQLWDREARACADVCEAWFPRWHSGGRAASEVRRWARALPRLSGYVPARGEGRWLLRRRHSPSAGAPQLAREAHWPPACPQALNSTRWDPTAGVGRTPGRDSSSSRRLCVATTLAPAPLATLQVLPPGKDVPLWALPHHLPSVVRPGKLQSSPQGQEAVFLHPQAVPLRQPDSHLYAVPSGVSGQLTDARQCGQRLYLPNNTQVLPVPRQGRP